MDQNLSNAIKIIRDKAASTASTAYKGTAIDMANFEGCLWLIPFGTITGGAVTSVKIQHSDTNVDGDFVDVADGEVTVADDDDDNVFWLDIYRPRKRYVRAYVDRATQNAEVETIIAMQYGSRKLPIANDNGILAVSPASE